MPAQQVNDCTLLGEGHAWAYRVGRGIPQGIVLKRCMICPATEIDTAEHDRQIKEKAWDEGMEVGYFSGETYHDNWKKNPYRKEL